MFKAEMTRKIFGYTLSTIGLTILLWVGYGALAILKPVDSGMAENISRLLYFEIVLGFFWVACIAGYLYFVGLVIARRSRPAFIAGIITTVIFILYLVIELVRAGPFSYQTGIIDAALVVIFISVLVVIKKYLTNHHSQCGSKLRN